MLNHLNIICLFKSIGMVDLLDIIQKTFNDTTKISLFQKIKTGNTVIDTLLSTIILTFMSYVVKIFYENEILYNICWPSDYQDKIKSLFFKKHAIIFEGKRCTTISYSSYPVISSCFTDSFKAIWNDIIENIYKNDSIYELKELSTSIDKIKKSEIDSQDNDPDNLFIVSQKKSFLYNKDLKIYAITHISSEDMDDKKNKPASKTDNIKITLYSYHTNVNEIKQYVKQIKQKYLSSIANSRSNQKFIYTLIKTKYEDYRYECWEEYLFESTRTFNNIFFENHDQIIKKIQFFLDNRDWYYEMGIPYSLGVGLHGPPGTGKTSFFKCLANMTGRHLVVLPLKLIKTRQQLNDFFFEDRYNADNKIHDIGFDKKIIVIEDIDCLGDIVLNREYTNTRKKRPVKNTNTETTLVTDMLQTFIETSNSEQNKVISTVLKPTEGDPITLDDILNLWDGLKETPGRILGISSNHYAMLDPALIRPGRIDITIKLDNATHNIIQQMYKRYYKLNIDEKLLKKIVNKFYSPAEIINCYVMHKDDPDAFIKRLQQNQKF